MTYLSKIRLLTSVLYPTGRAYKGPTGGWRDKLHRAMGIHEAKAYADNLATLSAILPDNDNFTADDATDWERRLGLITNLSVPLADRKAAILRKMNHPGTIKARQHYLYLQGQLQLAGFNVFVHENRFDDGNGGLVTIDISEFIGIGIDGIGTHGEFEHGEIEHGDATTVFPELFTFATHGEFSHGEMEHGGFTYNEVVANEISAAADFGFNTGSNLRSTFFIGGEEIGTFASVPANREAEFRQLILRIKPVQTIGFLLINYTT